MIPVSAEAARRNERVMATVVFVVFTGFAFVIPFLPLYVRALGVREEHVALWAGVLIGVSPLLAGALAPLWGRLADRYGHKMMATRALVSYVFILTLSAVVANVWQLFALRVGVGLFGGIGPLALVMASSYAPKGEAGRAIGLMQAAQILSAAVGPFAGGVLADTIGIRPTFAVTGVMCGGAFLLLQRYYEEPPRPRRPPAPKADGGDVDAPGPRMRLAGLMVVLFLLNFVGRSFTPVLPLQIERLGVPTSRVALATGALVSFYSMAAALSATLLGRWSRRVPARRLLLLCVAVAAILLAPLAWARSFSVLLALATVLGFAFGGSLTLGYTIGDGLAPAGRRGAAFGYFTGAALFGGAVAPPAAGLLARWNLEGIYYFDVAVCILLAGLLALAPLASRRG